MRRSGITVKIAVVLALAAAGFSVASIANGESPMAVLTGTETVTTSQVTTTVASTTTTVGSTTTVPVSRKVAVCHKTGSKKHPYVTIKVAQSAVKAHLRHGDAFGSCTTKTVKALKAKAHKAHLAKLKKAKAKHHK
jgi:ABC-type phosphate transport system substrate-binding protein